MTKTRWPGLRRKLVGLLPARQQLRAYEWFKVRRQRGSISRADTVVISYPKSGRTWFRILLSRCYAATYGIDGDQLIKNDNFHRLNAAVPAVSWFHGKFMNEIGGGQDIRSFLADKKVIFLVRNPIDTSVSCYFHLFGGRPKPEKRAIQGLPKSMDDLPLDQFVLDSRWAVQNIVRFTVEWMEVLKDRPDVLIVRYEDLREDTAREMRRVGRFLGIDFSDGVIAEAVESSSFERLKEQERSGAIANSALKPRDADNPNSFKVRRGKVKGYLDYLGEDSVRKSEEILASQLPKTLGYG